MISSLNKETLKEIDIIQIKNELSGEYDFKEIQSELVRNYLKCNNIDCSNIKNKIVQDLLIVENESLRERLETINFQWEIKDLETIFYLFLDNDVIREKGVIFTPSYVSDYINGELFKDATPNSTICDLACGGGEFLISALNQFKIKFSHLSLISIIENNLYGIDILEENVYSTKLLLVLYALNSNENKEVIKFNIIKANSTRPDILDEFNQSSILEGFDFIVGNPPYVKIQDIEKEDRKKLKENYISCSSGNYNLFYAFIEQSCKLIDDKGKIGYIIPNHLLKMKSAQALRELLIDNKLINKVIDFKDNQLFENVQTYSAIIFFDKSPKKSINYKTIEKNLKNIDVYSYIKSLEFEKMNYIDVNAETINLLSDNDYNNIYKIENQSYSLNISTGIATQKDILYMIDLTQEINKNENDKFYYKEYNGLVYKIEKEITVSIIKGSGEKKINTATSFYEFNKIIYPYEIIDNRASLIIEEDMIKRYPNTLRYFIDIKKELNKRNSGNPTTKIWYEYGRAQALNSYIPKIIFPTNSGKPNFAYFDDFALFHNGYAIYGFNEEEKEMDLPLLTKILNSEIMDYYIKLTSYMISGGYYCYQKKYLKNFKIPSFSEDEKEYLRDITSKELIDKFLINKYGLQF